MKKTLIALAAVAAVGTSSAQVAITGGVDFTFGKSTADSVTGAASKGQLVAWDPIAKKARWVVRNAEIARYNSRRFAGIAQLVERNLAKVEVESSRLFSRSRFFLEPGHHQLA